MGLDWDQIRADNQQRLEREGNLPPDTEAALPAVPERTPPKPGKARPRAPKGQGPGRGRPGQPRPEGRFYPAWVYADILALYEHGWRIGAISFALDLNRTTIKYHIGRAGKLREQSDRSGPLSRDEVKAVARYWLHRGMLEVSPDDSPVDRIEA